MVGRASIVRQSLGVAKVSESLHSTGKLDDMLDASTQEQEEDSVQQPLRRRAGSSL